ncbi:uncharacterized protein RAG0_02232 [Rhynchosporium agropyri]|uniref:2EXR domain-containing protein n=1 Tax=Rhynchosporium agropyri TaxID=914238 RepID=A0A1E1K158_9HELO|nr:uncharacterized protein RAG0_02232 [Rhynchosporium agropyri]
MARRYVPSLAEENTIYGSLMTYDYRSSTRRCSNQGPTLKFTPFNSLPLEIQTRIWSISCHEYGSTHVRVQRIAKDPRPKRPGAKPPSRPATLRILAPNRYPVPAFLHTCQSSRALALRYWTLWPCADPKRPHKEDGSSIYVNKAHDTIYFAEGLIDDFLFLRCISRAPQPDSGLPKNDWSKTYEDYSVFLAGVRHYAIDWWSWLMGTVNGDGLWISLLCISSNEDLTIVINPLTQLSDTKGMSSKSPRLKEITPGTVRAETVDTILRHIRSSPDFSRDATSADVLDTQVFKQGWLASEEPYREYMPNLKALTVLWTDAGQEDDQNGSKDELYLEQVKSQCRYHELKFTLESMSFEQEDLRKQMREAGTAFPDFTISMCGGHRYGSRNSL